MKAEIENRASKIWVKFNGMKNEASTNCHGLNDLIVDKSNIGFKIKEENEGVAHLVIVHGGEHYTLKVSDNGYSHMDSQLGMPQYTNIANLKTTLADWT